MADVRAMESKISMLQTQMAMLSLTVASIQAHIKELDRSIKSMSVETPALAEVNTDLNIDDDCLSEGYDSDDSGPLVRPTQDGTVPYVIVSWEDEGYESDENTIEEL